MNASYNTQAWISQYNQIRTTEDKRLKLKEKQHDNDFGKKSQPYHIMEDMFSARQQLFGLVKRSNSAGTRYVVGQGRTTRTKGLSATATGWRQKTDQHDDGEMSSPDMVQTDGFRNFKGRSLTPLSKKNKYRDTFLQVDEMETEFGPTFRIKDTFFEKEIKSIRAMKKEPDLFDDAGVIPFPKSYPELDEMRKARAENIKQWEATVPTKRDFFIKQTSKVAHEETAKLRCEVRKPKGFFAKKPKTADADRVMLL